MENDGVNLILKYFPDISSEQQLQFEKLGALYHEWNEKINVISRKDIDNLYAKHILHSLAIARFLGDVAPATKFMDLGTGGGFPGIPLAIMYPQCRFHLIDRIGKKLRVAEDIADKIALKNVSFQHGDSGECHEKFDYVVSRAVMPLNALVKAAAKNVSHKTLNGNKYANGIICLKGGDLTEEMAGISYPVIDYNLNEFFSELFYTTKQLIYVPVAFEAKK